MSLIENGVNPEALAVCPRVMIGDEMREAGANVVTESDQRSTSAKCATGKRWWEDECLSDVSMECDVRW